MSLAVTIRNVPDEVRNELASRAALKGWSLQQFLLHELVELSRRPDRHLLVTRLRASTDGHPPLSIDEILAARDADRR
jgi:antitoxin FitA